MLQRVKSTLKQTRILKLLFVFTAMIVFPLGNFAQTLIEPNEDSTFVKEYRNDEEWGIIAKNGFVVSMGNKFVKDDYGKFYHLQIIVQNLTNEAYTFEPDSITALVIKKNSVEYPMKVYLAKGFQKKIKNEQAWAQFFLGIASGINISQASYQTSYVPTTGYGGYTYMQPVTTYNASGAAIANMMATNQMMDMAKQMEIGRKVRDEGYLKKNTIHPGEGIAGYMNVKRDKGVQMTVIVPVKGEKYVFKWNISKTK